MPKHKFVTSFIGHESWIRSAKFAPEEDIIATVSDDRTNRLFDLNSGKEIHAFKETKGFATHLDFHPSGTCIGLIFSSLILPKIGPFLLQIRQFWLENRPFISLKLDNLCLKFGHFCMKYDNFCLKFDNLFFKFGHFCLKFVNICLKFVCFCLKSEFLKLKLFF